MRMRVPYIGDGKPGNEKQIGVDLGNVSWKLIAVDDAKKQLIIEVTATDRYSYREMVDDVLTDKTRLASAQDKVDALAFAKAYDVTGLEA